MAQKAWVLLMKKTLYVVGVSFAASAGEDQCYVEHLMTKEELESFELLMQNARRFAQFGGMSFSRKRKNFDSPWQIVPRKQPNYKISINVNLITDYTVEKEEVEVKDEKVNT